FDPESAEMADAREKSWYAQTPLGPIVLRHAQAWEVLRDRRFVNQGGRFLQNQGITEGPLYDWFSGMLAQKNGPDHTRLRGLINKAFTRSFVERLRPFIQSTTARLADQVATGVEVDFVSCFARPVAGLVMCQMLGIPVDDYEQFTRWADDLGLVFNAASEFARSQDALLGMAKYVDGLIEQRRSNPGDDLLSSLITAEEVGDRLTPQELHDTVLLLVWAGQDTTTKQFGRALVAFSRHPQQWQALADRPELAEQAVEEVCRWSPQARMTFRFAGEDITLHDLHLPADSMVLVSIVAGNRDPRAYQNPEVFDITAPREATQLVFGGGIHICLGMNAARLELAEGLVALASRFGPPELAGEIRWPPPTAMIHGPELLPLRFTGRS
ncbi:MAG: cytochrome P450, partial [Micromonosporaceae bacterium]|nr:cytochrome P450 [Micromonosporaceae bacterium]